MARKSCRCWVSLIPLLVGILSPKFSSVPRQHYDANGNPIGAGCTKSSHCFWVHPSDPEWQHACTAPIRGGFIPGNGRGRGRGGFHLNREDGTAALYGVVAPSTIQQQQQQQHIAGDSTATTMAWRGLVTASSSASASTPPLGQNNTGGASGKVGGWGEPGGRRNSAAGNGWGAASTSGWASSLGGASTADGNAVAWGAWAADNGKTETNVIAGGWGSSSAGASSVPKIATWGTWETSDSKLADADSHDLGTPFVEQSEKQPESSILLKTAQAATPYTPLDLSGLRSFVSSGPQPPYISGGCSVDSSEQVSKTLEQPVPQTAADLHRDAHQFVM
jgi:hypothetical protein